MMPLPPPPEFEKSLQELRSKRAVADEQQAHCINRQILHRLATRIRYLEVEMDLFVRSSSTEPGVPTFTVAGQRS
jgi:hypothetical protein